MGPEALSGTGLLLPLFLVGLLGGVHCFGMCGGIVGALSASGPVSPLSGAHPKPAGSQASIHLAYNAGRLTSYSLAGWLAGAMGAGSMDAMTYGRPLLYALASLMLVLLGLYLSGLPASLTWLERMGSRIWRRIAPLGRHLLPARTPARALLLGLLWGWLPCGLVYSALISAATSGSAWMGAGVMLSFGLGTVPNLLASAWIAQKFRVRLAQHGVRKLAGGGILLWGVWGLVGVFRQFALLSPT